MPLVMLCYMPRFEARQIGGGQELVSCLGQKENGELLPVLFCVVPCQEYEDLLSAGHFPLQVLVNPYPL